MPDEAKVRIGDVVRVTGGPFADFRGPVGSIAAALTLVSARGRQLQEGLVLGGHLVCTQLVGTIYGMNFDHMPELHWVHGYPFAILLMAVVCTSLYVIFKRRDWL